MPKSPHEMMTAMLNNLEERTSHPLDYWLAVAEKSGEEKHMDIIKHLKADQTWPKTP
ncbi:MAG: DUF4287 domain-containing protein [Candidatus Marinimicrobia bacterium]|nr:DUF4287 domain-containing protein [Candidatus Neomarinimicrobiota bacterium]